jgi:hypothetical protein
VNIFVPLIEVSSQERIFVGRGNLTIVVAAVSSKDEESDYLV